MQKRISAREGFLQDRHRLVLASASPRRIALIKKIPRLSVAVFPLDCDESFAPGTPPQNAAMLLAERKAETACERLTRQKCNELFGKEIFGRELTAQNEKEPVVVLGADTMVVTAENEILGKPKTEREAEAMFRQLCGSSHSVITGYCLTLCGLDSMQNPKKVKNFVKTVVTFGAFNDKIVYNYIISGAPYDKAGGYGIQDDALAPLIVRVDGPLDNVIGLPVTEIQNSLKEFFAWR